MCLTPPSATHVRQAVIFPERHGTLGEATDWDSPGAGLEAAANVSPGAQAKGRGVAHESSLHG